MVINIEADSTDEDLLTAMREVNKAWGNPLVRQMCDRFELLIANPPCIANPPDRLRCRVWIHPGIEPRGRRCIRSEGHSGDHYWEPKK